MMKILVLAPVYPYPPDNGAKRRMAAFLEYFSPRHEVTIATLVESDPGGEEWGDWEAELVPWRNRKVLPILGAVLTGRTYRDIKFWEPALQDRVDSLLAGGEYDVLWVNFLNMTRYLAGWVRGEERHAVTILDQHNLETQFWETFRRKARSPLVRLFGRLEYHKARRLQQTWYPRFDVIAGVSEEDLEQTRAYVKERDAGLWLVPNGVDTGYFTPSEGGREGHHPPKIVFTGSMDAYMNQQAAVWFAEKVWPSVRQAVPNAEFAIVGRNPGPAVRKLSSDAGISVTGAVPDIRAYMAGADAAVVPIHMGGGTKLKTLEAMAMGLPVVSTPAGAQGLAVTSGEELLLADSAEGFAQGVIRLVENRELAKAIGSKARALVERQYNWKSIYARVEQGLHNLLLETADQGDLAL